MERIESSHSRITGAHTRDAILGVLGRGATARLSDGAPCEARATDTGTLDLVPTGDLDELPGRDLRLHFNIHAASFELEGAWRKNLGRVELGPNLEVFSANRRRHPRLRMPGFAQFAALGASAVPLIDASPDGLRILAPSGTNIRVGAYGFTEVGLDGTAFDGWARVRRVERTSRGTAIGLTFEPRERRCDYVRALIDSAYPAMEPRSLAAEDEVVEMLDAAGYLKLTAGRIPPAWHRFESPDSFELVYRAHDKKLLAHLSVTRAFSSTWIYHQLAGVPRHEESVASRYASYSILSQIPTLMDGDRAHALAYFDPTLPWHGRYVYAFEKWMDAPEDMIVDKVDRFHLDTAQPLGIAAPGARVEPMRDEDRRAVYRIVAAGWPPLVARAFDISPATLVSDGLVGPELGRSRHVFVLRRHGEVIATALAERGHPSASLFGMFDIAHVLVAPDAAPTAQELNLLVEYVRRWYGTQGIKRPILTAPLDVIAKDAHPAMRFVEQMGRFVLNARGLRHYENFLHYTFGEYRLVAERKRLRHAS